MPIPPDAKWDLGEDNLGRNAHQALLAAGITPAMADGMTRDEIKAIPGLEFPRSARIAARLVRMRFASETVVERKRRLLDSTWGRELSDSADVTIPAGELRELVALAEIGEREGGDIVTELTAAAHAALDAVADEHVGETEMLCEAFGVPTEYARHVAAMMATCAPAGAL
jgi:hypothetical protein